MVVLSGFVAPTDQDDLYSTKRLRSLKKKDCWSLAPLKNSRRLRLGMKSKQTRKFQLVYAELRAALGDRIAGGDILRLALLVCDAADEQDEDESKSTRRDHEPAAPLRCFSRSTKQCQMVVGNSCFGRKIGLKLDDDYDPRRLRAQERTRKFEGQVLMAANRKMD